ncbi:MAG TPA: ATP-grasp domain-containing protein [Hyphomonadaceae bacterium]|nr:ATP-grasp domain-containing protein [Hyphomonadaceae bacterium]
MIARRVPPMPSPVLVECYEILRGRGYAVTEDIAEEVLRRPDLMKVEADLYLLKPHTELSLALAGVLFTQAANMLNSYQSCSLIQSKIITSKLLRQAGIPAPDSWVTGDLSLAKSLLEKHPLIIKPHTGHRGDGVHLCKTPEDIHKIPPPATPMIIQEAIPGPGEVLKIYCVGDQVQGVRKQYSEPSFSVVGRHGEVTDEIRKISQRVGEVCGLGLYGLDIIESDRGPYVVDVNYFPSYKGVPNAAGLVANYINDYAKGNVTLKLPDRGER